jgi:hypothetical protein
LAPNSFESGDDQVGLLSLAQMPAMDVRGDRVGGCILVSALDDVERRLREIQARSFHGVEAIPAVDQPVLGFRPSPRQRQLTARS